jgi:hypothetical protein
VIKGEIMMMRNLVNRMMTPGTGVLTVLAFFFGSWLFFGVSHGSAQVGDGGFYDVREIETSELGVPNPAGLAYSPKAGVLLVVDDQEQGKHNPQVAMINLTERLEGTSSVTGTTTELLVNMAYSETTNSLFLLNQVEKELEEVPLKRDGELASSAAVSAKFNIQAYGLSNAKGMTFDPQDGRLFLLDAGGDELVTVTPDENGSYEGGPADKAGRIERVDLRHLGAVKLRGIAYNPMNAHLYLLDPDSQQLYEIRTAGELISTFDMSPFDLRDPQGMVFANSGDLTDDPAIMDLYVADSGQSKNSRPGRIMEFAFPLP